ncbi:uncharacterized protein [Haliotis asinina]|uniref:uncharacterized protein n=1 Tax=Haliotis asinina TaxID=109174 RepID=UPI003531AA22
MFTKDIVLWVIITLRVGVAVDTNYFKCYKDFCRRGEQYCVEERQRCYHCADVAHLCNTNELSRECDSYCNRIALEEMIREKDKALSEAKTELHSEQETSAKLNMKVTKLNTKLYQLKESGKSPVFFDSETKRGKSEHEDVVKQNEWLKASLIGVGSACGVLGLVVITLTGVLCSRCSQKEDNPNDGESPLPPVPEKEMLHQLPGQLCPLLQVSGDYVTIGTKSHVATSEDTNIFSAARPKCSHLA